MIRATVGFLKDADFERFLIYLSELGIVPLEIDSSVKTKDIGPVYVEFSNEDANLFMLCCDKRYTWRYSNNIISEDSGCYLDGY